MAIKSLYFLRQFDVTGDILRNSVQTESKNNYTASISENGR